LSFPPQRSSLEEARVFCLFAAALIQFQGVYLSALGGLCCLKSPFFYTRPIKSFASNMAIAHFIQATLSFHPFNIIFGKSLATK
jgi:hypothetical protein